jgi:hypothetical protein
LVIDGGPVVEQGAAPTRSRRRYHALWEAEQKNQGMAFNRGFPPTVNDKTGPDGPVLHAAYLTA